MFMGEIAKVMNKFVFVGGEDFSGDRDSGLVFCATNEPIVGDHQGVGEYSPATRFGVLLSVFDFGDVRMAEACSVRKLPAGQAEPFPCLPKSTSCSRCCWCSVFLHCGCLLMIYKSIAWGDIGVNSSSIYNIHYSFNRQFSLNGIKNPKGFLSQITTVYKNIIFIIQY